jgi:hypothetical protein
MYRNPRTLTTLALGVAILAACDREAPVSPTAVPESASQSRADREPTFRPHEAEFHRLSDEIEGYGGHFFDEHGNLVVHLRDPAQAGRAQQHLQPTLDARPLGAREVGTVRQGSIVVRQAEFEFPELARWRDRASDEVLGKDGVVFTDLDEAANRVVIGVSSPAARIDALRTLRRSAVPAEAVQFVDAEEPTFDQSVRNRFRPLRGGFQISSPSGSCTLGFNAIRAGQHVVLTNSHCTSIYWGADGTPIYQATVAASNLVGPEIHDPAGAPCGFLGLQRCRWSDAAVIRRNAGVTSDFGYIARTQSWATGLGNAGSIQINTASPRMQITSELAFPSVNQVLDKIGRTTGWTYGQVDRTCVDLSVPSGLGVNGTVRCQDLTRNMHTSPGDSGSPMFVWQGSTVRLAGLHWGRVTYAGTNVAIMSAMSNIRSDLGPMSTH